MDPNSVSSKNPQVDAVSVSSPVPSNQPAAPTPPVDIQPVGGPREQGPLSQTIAQEVVKPTEVEPVISPEVKDAGVVAVPNQDQIQVKPELKDIGVAAVKTAVPVQSVPSGFIQLPITEEEAKNNIKSHPVFDSARWLSTQILEQFKKMHRSLNTK